MKLLLTSAGISNASIAEALVELADFLGAELDSPSRSRNPRKRIAAAKRHPDTYTLPVRGPRRQAT